MIKAELHCHTCFSKDSLVRVEDLVATCQKKGIQRLVVTDHNTIQGATQANILDPQRFIIGEEIMTLQGELIGIFVKENIPPGLPASKTIEIIRAQGAFISVAHPFDTYRKGHWDHNDLLDIVGYIDAIEVFNSRCLSPQFNQQAQDFAMQHKLLGTVGSDSHSLLEVGAASFIMPDFNDSSSLKQSLQTAQAQVKLSSPWVHFFSRYAAFRKRVATKSA